LQFKSQWFGEALATPAYPLDSREETIFEALGGPSWIGDLTRVRFWVYHDGSLPKVEQERIFEGPVWRQYRTAGIDPDRGIQVRRRLAAGGGSLERTRL
jgi:hypothetical protein